MSESKWDKVALARLLERTPGARVVGRFWRCGEECLCVQPQVIIQVPGRLQDHWLTRLVVWEGEFCSEPEAEETRRMKQELTEAIERLGAEDLREDWEK